VAAGGAGALFSAGGAERIVKAAQGGALPSLVTAEDLRGYRAVEREPVCGAFIAYRVCTVGPPSYGGIFLLQVLQMMQARSNGHYDFGDPDFLHVFIEASKLARADRAAYVGDPDFVHVPTQGLVSSDYLRGRAASIDAREARPAAAGAPPGVAAAPLAERGAMMGGTSQLTVADADGDIVAMTTTINLGFGSGIMVDGFILNDVLVNFSAASKPGTTLANGMAPHKRPFTSMAPAIVFDEKGYGARELGRGAACAGPPDPDPGAPVRCRLHQARRRGLDRRGGPAARRERRGSVGRQRSSFQRKVYVIAHM
jgi:gamma-glutamyltranspeptidase / glutathione hydrolase